MKKVSIFAAGLLLSATTTFAQSWSVDKAHSRLGFGIMHLGVCEIDGNFNDFSAKITATKPDLSDATIEMTADVNTINTDNEARDKHLKSPDFFDAATNPTITFKSTSFKKVSGKMYKVTGNLTMHGVTKPVTLNAELVGKTTNPMSKKEVTGFKITGPIKRADFNIAASMPGTMLGENVMLQANTEFTKD